MKPFFLFGLIVSLVLFTTVLGQQTCPECYSNRGHLTGHGTASDGRTRANIVIETPQGTPEYAILNGAVGGAVGDWNTKTDGSGNKIPYSFEQGTDLNQADFIITIGTPGGGCAQIDTSVFPHVITVSATLLQQDPADIEAAIQHELGHRLGLAEASNTAACGTSTTIMRGQVNCVFVVHQLQASDVTQVRNNYNNPNSCTRLAPATAGVEDEPGCDPSQEEDCYFGGGNWDPFNCACSYPPPESCPDGGCNEGSDAFPSDYCAYPQTGCPYPYFSSGSCCTYNHSPILVDVDGSGFHLTTAANGVWFDFSGRGTPIKIAWTSANSTNAWLVLDRNGNGTIDNAKEMFGSLTAQPISADPNGFIALAEYDKANKGGNGDGTIDKTDAIFSRLRLWQDLNHNGVSEFQELSSLSKLGIESISMRYKESRRTDEFGNQYRYRAKIDDERHSQAVRWAWDVILAFQ